MRNKKAWISVGVILAVLATVLFCRQWLISNAHGAADSTDLSESYQAAEEIEQARQKLAQRPVTAKILTAGQGGPRQIALVFDGLPDRATTARLVDILAKYNAKAVFFVEGQNAAEQPESIQLIDKAGQQIGNYTFIGLAEVQKLQPEDALAQLCRTQKVVEVLTGHAPKLFRAPHTVYTEMLLKEVTAAGLVCAVKSNVALPRNSLHGQADADAFVAKLAPGSILAISVGAAVEVKQMEAIQKDARPAVDKKPTIAANEAALTVQREALADEVDRLLLALQKQKIATAFVADFRQINSIPAGILSE